MPDITGVYNGKNKDRHDKWYTPKKALDMIYEHLMITNDIPVWDPFCGDGRIGKYFEEKGHETKNTDIETGTDFLGLDAEQIYKFPGYIISNPPYSLTTKILEKWVEIFKSYNHRKYGALLMPLTVLDSRKRFMLLKELQPEILVPSRRFQFENSQGKSNNRINFLTCWFVFDCSMSDG